MKIVMTKELDGLWATPEELARLTDEEVVELVHEDLAELCDRATFEVIRDMPTAAK
jgi:hypothetical protein